MNTATIQPTTVTAKTAAFWQGFDDYCKGARVEQMPSAEHRNGWWHALRCAADTEDYESDIADRQQWMRGSW